MTSDEVLIDHALGTMPDSLSARKRLLRALLNKMKSTHPQYRPVMGMMAALDRHEAAQKKLFPPSHHDGGGIKGDGQ